MAILAGGLVLWSELRRPRDLRLEIDLTEALPGEVTGVDLVIERDGALLVRRDLRYGKEGAPGLVTTDVHARPGTADVEVTLVGAKGPARRTRATIDLRSGRPARMVAR